MSTGMASFSKRPRSSTQTCAFDADFEGLLNIAVGIVHFLGPGITVLAFVLLIAAWAIVSGTLTMAAGFRLNIDHGQWWLVLGRLLSLAYSVLLIFTPLIGALLLTWWLGAYARRISAGWSGEISLKPFWLDKISKDVALRGLTHIRSEVSL
jgi:uncharacterized membrane protein HdeD (DUF308 family)